MTFFKKHKPIFFLILSFLFIVLLGTFIYYGINKWENSIIEENKKATELSVIKLCNKAETVLKNIKKEYLFSENITNKDLKKLDSTLKLVTKEILKDYKGLKGGFYLVRVKRFTGYSFPNSKPPYPVYGPPPRSYSIIEDQVLLTTKKKKLIINLHRFEPDVFFPLATKPVYVDEGIPVIAWTRTHIGRKLPKSKLKKAGTYIAIISLTVLIILIYFSIKIRSDIQKINKQLDNIQNEPDFRLKSNKGIFGNIINSVNYMLEKLQKVNFERRELERQLHQKEKMASLGRIAAGIAHEVKTPLAVIKTRFQIWQSKIKSNNNDNEIFFSNESTEMILAEINRLSKLINRLLIFSRPINKKFSLTDINLLLNDVIFMMQMKDTKKTITYITNFCEDIPKIEIDANSLKQVIINLISNSTEAINEKGSIFVATKYEDHYDFIKIKISDTGKNISDDIINSIFDPFFTTKETGVGLGLSISYEIIKAHNGTIAFKNRRKEKGVKCIIELPIKQKKDLT